MDQRTTEWFQARLGKLTASRIADALARTKTGWGASRANLKATLVAERLTGVSQDTYTNAAMQWGVDIEPKARAAYEFYHDADVVEVGFIDHWKIAMSGCSPDGMIGNDGLLEIKCPSVATHIDTLLGAEIDGKYIKQMQWQMACTGRAWCDYASFDPRLPIDMQLHVRRVRRDQNLIEELEREAIVFLSEIDDTIFKLRAKFPALSEAA